MNPHELVTPAGPPLERDGRSGDPEGAGEEGDERLIGFPVNGRSADPHAERDAVPPENLVPRGPGLDPDAKQHWTGMPHFP